MARYANILNDDAWKVVIFTPGNEDLMARMLEVLLPGKKIQSLVFRPTEQHGLTVSDKITIFDAVCTSDTGEMFIVEMQGLRGQNVPVVVPGQRVCQPGCTETNASK